MYFFHAPFDQPKDKASKERRCRGRPRLSEEEKQRRKELRDLGLMKRSKRRTKEREWFIFTFSLSLSLPPLPLLSSLIYVTNCMILMFFFLCAYLYLSNLIRLICSSTCCVQRWPNGVSKRSLHLQSVVVSLALGKRTSSKLPRGKSSMCL